MDNGIAFVEIAKRKWQINHLGRDEKNDGKKHISYRCVVLRKLTIRSVADEVQRPVITAPRILLRYSHELDARVLYTTANLDLDTMRNHDKKVSHVVTKEGHAWANNCEIKRPERLFSSKTP